MKTTYKKGDRVMIREGTPTSYDFDPKMVYTIVNIIHINGHTPLYELDNCAMFDASDLVLVSDDRELDDEDCERSYGCGSKEAKEERFFYDDLKDEINGLSLELKYDETLIARMYRSDVIHGDDTLVFKAGKPPKGTQWTIKTRDNEMFIHLTEVEEWT